MNPKKKKIQLIILSVILLILIILAVIYMLDRRSKLNENNLFKDQFKNNAVLYLESNLDLNGEQIVIKNIASFEYDKKIADANRAGDAYIYPYSRVEVRLIVTKNKFFRNFFAFDSKTYIVYFQKDDNGEMIITGFEKID